MFFLVGPLFAAATSADRCSLNGDYNGNTCKCDMPWTGEHCDVLSFDESDPRGAYHNSTAASWGGNVLFDSRDRLYHLFVAQMTNRCGLEHYGTNSEIVRAVSKSATGPFEYAETIVKPFAHNPTAIFLPNDTGVVIFFIGSGTIQNQADCRHNLTTAGRPKALVGGAIHVVHAPTVLGPWTGPIAVEFNDTQGGPWTRGGTNPSPHVSLDGTVTLAVQRPFNGTAGSAHKELIGVARADSWRGPYQMLTATPVEPEHWLCLAGTGEDPFIWRNRRGWHMIYHGMCPSGVFQAHYAFSNLQEDASSWSVSPRQTYSYDVKFKNHTSILFARVERPQLIFSPETGQPIALFNGVCRAFSLGEAWACEELISKTPVMTWTLSRPLKTL